MSVRCVFRPSASADGLAAVVEDGVSAGGDGSLGKRGLETATGAATGGAGSWFGIDLAIGAAAGTGAGVGFAGSCVLTGRSIGFATSSKLDASSSSSLSSDLSVNLLAMVSMDCLESFTDGGGPRSTTGSGAGAGAALGASVFVGFLALEHTTPTAPIVIFFKKKQGEKNIFSHKPFQLKTWLF